MNAMRRFWHRLRCAFRGHRPKGTVALLSSDNWSEEFYLDARRCDCGAWIADYGDGFR